MGFGSSISDNKRIVLGCGSGRCGTKSLSRILSLQYGCESTHEGCHITWGAPLEEINSAIGQVVQRKSSCVADVGFYWLYHIPFILSGYYDPLEISCICLQRDKEETIASYIRHIPNFDPLRKPQTKLGLFNTGERRWGPMYPDYSTMLTKEQAIGRFYDYYYHEAEAIAQEFPDNFIILDMNEFMSDHGVQAEALDFLGFPSPVTNTSIRENASAI